MGVFGPVPAESLGLVGARALAVRIGALTKEPLPPAQATAAHLDETRTTARLTFSLTRPVKAHTFVLAAPDRVIVDLPAVDFRMNPLVGDKAWVRRHGGVRHAARSRQSMRLIKSFRFGLFAPGKSRVVINLAAPARVLRAASKPATDGKTSELVIALAKTNTTAFQAAAKKAVLVAEAAAAKLAAAPAANANNEAHSKLPVIVIDPGHGGVDSGAVFNGVLEKNVVLAFGKMLAAKLRATGRYKVVMTRDSDVFIPLGGRVRIAQKAHADLFISIHADTIPGARYVSGATVYTDSERASDAAAARTAQRENASDAAAGVSNDAKPKRVSNILFDLTRQETRMFSHVFARTLVNYWKVAAKLNKNPERSAGFVVLTAPDIPSVLLELGYLSNVKDAKSLVSPKWRDETTSEMVAAINSYFDKRGTSVIAATPGKKAQSKDSETAAATPVNVAAQPPAPAQ